MSKFKKIVSLVVAIALIMVNTYSVSAKKMIILLLMK